MPYAAEISRTNPTCFLFMIDQSRSMIEPFGADPDKKKSQEVAIAINRLLQTLVLRCAKGADVLDRFHVGVIGYGGTNIGTVFGGALAGQTLVPISKLAANPLRVELRSKRIDDGAGGLVEQKIKFPVWFEPTAAGKTPMCKALGLACNWLRVFLAKHPACFPPIVINISDGKSTDGNPVPHSEKLREMASKNGNVLLFNVHLSARGHAPIELPSSERGLSDDLSKTLFRMSSVLPEPLRESAARDGYVVNEHTRGFVFNADLVSVIRFLDIGTRVDLRKHR
jgi:hypothetical protein